ncbi:hypothetical protein, partial [Parafrankia sp. Ea1.12]
TGAGRRHRAGRVRRRRRCGSRPSAALRRRVTPRCRRAPIAGSRSAVGGLAVSRALGASAVGRLAVGGWSGSERGRAARAGTAGSATLTRRLRGGHRLLGRVALVGHALTPDAQRFHPVP